MEQNNRILSSLCYFSIFFAGFILPLIVMLVVKDRDVKKHATHALISHLLLYVPAVIFFIILATMGIFASAEMSDSTGAALGIGVIIFIIFMALFSLAIVIWNIVRGIQVLTQKEADER